MLILVIEINVFVSKPQYLILTHMWILDCRIYH